jgi:hypothetical protein
VFEKSFGKADSGGFCVGAGTAPLTIAGYNPDAMSLKRVWQRLMQGAEKAAQRIPAVQRRLEAEYAQVEQMARAQARPCASLLREETVCDCTRL